MFEGVFCPSITITDDDGKIDYELWGRHLDHLADAGIDGVLLFGSIGEFYSVSLEDKKSVVDFAVERVAGRMKIFVGVGDTTYDNVLDLTRHAQKAGADAVLAVSPYYFGPTDDAAEKYFGGIADATDLPVVLYNFPARTGTDLSPELVARLAAAHPNICGIKDTVDTISHTRKVIRAVRQVNPEFSVLSGFDEYYLVNRASGGNGVLCGLTNVEPELFVRMHGAYQAGDFATAIECAERISSLMAVYDVPHIDNWSVCDSTAATCKFMAKEPEVWLPWLRELALSEAEFTARFGLVCLLDHFTANPEHRRMVLSVCGEVPCPAPYARLAVAWAVSATAANEPALGLAWLRQDTLDTATHNKAVQKACESLRLTPAQKAAFRALKRKP